MFLVCAGCHKVVNEVESLLNFEVRHTLCEECHHNAILEYLKMQNEFYYEEQLVLKENRDIEKT